MVREGKHWVIRQINNMYISGQTEPLLRVACPGSRAHIDFKSSFTRAFILKEFKSYDSVNIDHLRQVFRGETDNAILKVLKQLNALTKDQKNYRIHGDLRSG